jgi:hypothetical protein
MYSLAVTHTHGSVISYAYSLCLNVDQLYFTSSSERARSELYGFLNLGEVYVCFPGTKKLWWAMRYVNFVYWKQGAVREQEDFHINENPILNQL